MLTKAQSVGTLCSCTSGIETTSSVFGEAINRVRAQRTKITTQDENDLEVFALQRVDAAVDSGAVGHKT